MLKPYQILGITIGIVTVGLLLTVEALNQAGFCLNVTHSMPTGLYRCHPMKSQSFIRRGMLVSICPPNTSAFRLAIARRYIAPGACPLTQTQPLLKPVAAVAGDEILIDQQGIWVNGQLLPNSQARSTDSQGRMVQKMLQGTYRVQAGEVWLVSSHSPRSFDSRYFGPVPVSQIQWIVKPILTGDD